MICNCGAKIGISRERLASKLWEYEKGGSSDYKTEASLNEKKVYRHKADAILADEENILEIKMEGFHKFFKNILEVKK